jgi:aldose 1-epimerase
LEVYTTEPGLQIYTGNSFDGSLKDTKYGKKYKKYAAICLETQMLPNSVNNPHFPNSILLPEDEYHQHTVYKIIFE